MTESFVDSENESDPEDGDLGDSGSLPHVLCSLARECFTGLMELSRGSERLTFWFQDGNPVFVEDPGAGLAAHFLGQGLLTKDGYAQVVKGMTESLVHSEDASFCEQALSLGLLEEAQLRAEVLQRVRTKLLQCVTWAEVDVLIDDSPDAVEEGGWPQPIGPIVYIAVRTFFDEAEVQEVLPKQRARYARLTAPVEEIVAFFGLEVEEQALLGGLGPSTPVQAAIAHSGMDPFDAWQVLALLRLADFAQFDEQPRASHKEVSGEYLTSRPRPPERRGYDPRVEEGSGLISEEVVRIPPRGRPAVRPVQPAQAAQPAQPQRGFFSSEAEGYRPSPPRATMPADVEPPVVTMVSSGAPSAGPAMGSKADSAKARKPPRRSRTEVKRQRRLGAVNRLGKELRKRRVSGAPVPRRAAQSEPVVSPPADTAQSKASATSERHLRELMLRRRRKAQEEQQGTPSRDVQALLRSGKELLRKQAYARAVEVLTELCEQVPDREQYKIYLMWAQLKAGAADEEQTKALRQLCRMCLTDDEVGPFAYYVLGHLALAEGKDDTAERLFRKAVVDRSNKDAQRHLMILQRRIRAAEAKAKQRGKLVIR